METQTLEKNKTLVIGASTNPSRYSNMAINRLLLFKKGVRALGLRKGVVNGIEIETEKVEFDDVDTVTLYIGPQNQSEYYDYVVSLHPRRVIFNPGTENIAFYQILDKAGIAHFEACTLVLLNTGQY